LVLVIRVKYYINRYQIIYFLPFVDLSGELKGMVNGSKEC